MSIDKKILSTMQEENDMTQKEAGSTGKRHLHSTLFSVSAGRVLTLGVTQVEDGVQFAVYLPDHQERYLKLYKKGRKKPDFEILLTEEFQVGGIYLITLEKKARKSKDDRAVEEILTQEYEYMYEADGKEFVDPYAVFITGRESWGKRRPVPVRGGICLETFDWEDDICPQIPYNDLILYQMHMRGFTKHSSSKVEHKGTFRGLIEKIPYLKELGINGVMLLPVYEFDEIRNRQQDYQIPADTMPKAEEKTVLLNYWGYGTKNTYYFAPKVSYASDKTRPSMEFKEMVKALHANGIEIIMDIYFTPGTNLFLMTDCLRNWVMQYHVDGFRVNQEVMPSLTLASDPVLSGVKIFGNYWDVAALSQAGISSRKNTLAEYNEGFLCNVRRFLKGDEGMVEKVVHSFARNESAYSVVNFITHVNGFTLMDLVSYDIKHNESNGEGNRDGAEINYSWNCGVEGKTRKRTVMDRRMTQIRNAFLMLLTSQGTPMILAGDEFGNTQMGNNNAYCHDDEMTWLNWNKTKRSESIFTFVKNMIAMRKSFRVFRQDHPLQMMDTLSCGMPDLSMHGVQAWRPDYSNYSRMLGMLYYGAYTAEWDGRSVYLIYNMYWESKSFDLPDLPTNGSWKVMVDTYDNTFDASLLSVPKTAAEKKRKKKAEPYISRKTVVAPRSIVIFVEV